MKNSILISIIVFVFIAGVFTGYLSNEFTESKNFVNEYFAPIELFIGTWTAMDESNNASNPMTAYYSWSFYENQTGLFAIEFVNETKTTPIEAWRTYKVTNDSLIVYLPGETIQIYDFSFSNQNQKLTLTRENIPLTFTKS